jgi:hypothetical protein
MKSKKVKILLFHYRAIERQNFDLNINIICDMNWKLGNDSGVIKGNDVPLNLLVTFGFKSKTKLF